jgi:hypothetical protein
MFGPLWSAEVLIWLGAAIGIAAGALIGFRLYFRKNPRPNF